jgi:hypothetical protein
MGRKIYAFFSCVGSAEECGGVISEAELQESSSSDVKGTLKKRKPSKKILKLLVMSKRSSILQLRRSIQDMKEVEQLFYLKSKFYCILTCLKLLNSNALQFYKHSMTTISHSSTMLNFIATNMFVRRWIKLLLTILTSSKHKNFLTKV